MEVEKIQRAIDAIKKDRPGYEQILDFFGKIVIEQSRFISQTSASFNPRVHRCLTKNDASRKLKNGVPLLDRKDFEIDTSSASRLFKKLCDILKSEELSLEHRSFRWNDEIGKIQSSLEKGDLSLEEIFQSTLTSECSRDVFNECRLSQLAQQLSLDRDVILFLATASLKPSLEVTVSCMKDLIENAPWSEHCCPVCGSRQAISELRALVQADVPGQRGQIPTEGAERILHCSFCGNEWQITRLGCTFCGNTDAESLQYFYAEGKKRMLHGYRIDVCDKCKKYIKTLDRREILHEIVPILEDVTTLHLDIIAEENGYKREAWFVPISLLVY